MMKMESAMTGGKSNIIVRKVIESDLPVIAKLIDEYNPEHTPSHVPYIEKYIADPMGAAYAFFVAYGLDDVNGVLGCGGYTPDSDGAMGVYWLGAIYTSRSHWRSGIGSAILQHIIRQLKSLGAVKLMTDTGGKENQPEAHNFYVKNGFRLISERKKSDGYPEDESIYRLDLVP